MDGSLKMGTGNKPLKMYNLNVNVATALSGGLLGLEGQCTTPRTPEILNSLIAMSNPLDNYEKIGQENTSPQSEENDSGTGSPLGSPSMSPPSVQLMCSQLIKEGLKLTLQSKRKHSGSDSRDEMDDFQPKRTKTEELTAEDEERRKRRRERNKIAATKCRMKKREKTANLVTESEVLEAQNIDLKTQIKDLEKQRRGLEEMLSQHSCVRRGQPVHATAPAPAETTFDHFAQPMEAFIDPEFGDTSGLISFNKDPNFGKFMDSFYPQNKVSRMKSETTLRGAFQCEEEDPDMYRPNCPLENSFFNVNDSGYSSFSTGTMDGCRA